MKSEPKGETMNYYEKLQETVSAKLDPQAKKLLKEVAQGAAITLLSAALSGSVKVVSPEIVSTISTKFPKIIGS